MEDDNASLTVGFQIEFGDSFGQLRSLEDIVGETAAKVYREAQNMEKALGGGFGLSGSTAEITSFGNAVTRQMAEMKRATDSAEKSGESMVRQLNRQIEVFGKTSSEIRTMRAELRAAEAERQNLTELAGRIREAAAEMNRLEAASGGVAAASGKNAFALRQVAVQLPDIVQGLLTGQKPFQVAIQQGGQLAQVAQMAEGGMKGFAASLLEAAAPFAPFAAAAGVAVGGFLLFDRAISNGVDTNKIVNDLGLTKDEIGKLKDVSVSTGDVVKATFQVMAEHVGVDLSNMKGWFGEAMDFLTKVGASTLAGLYAGFVGTFDSIGIVIRDLKAGKATDILGDIDKNMASRFDQARSALSQFGNEVTKQVAANKKADLEQQAAKLKADRSATSPGVDQHAQQMARDADATERQIANLYKLTDAYAASGGEALIAEARLKAETKALREGGDVAAAVAREIALEIAQQVSDTAKSTATLTQQAAMQRQVNALVAEGTVPAQQAAEALRQRIADLPLLAALEAAAALKGTARTTAIERATTALQRMRDAQLEANDAQTEAQRLSAMAAGSERLAELQDEIKLIGEQDAALTHMLTTLKAEREATDRGWLGSKGTAYVDQQVAIADAQVQLRVQTDAANESLRFQADLLDTIADNAQAAAQGLSESFGSAGRALGDLTAGLATYAAQQQRLSDAHQIELDKIAQIDKAAIRERRTREENTAFALRSSSLQIEAFRGMAASAKGFFAEHSAGYRAMDAAEKALAVAQVARTAVDVARGAARMFASLGPWAFPAVAAMVGVMASLGFSSGGTVTSTVPTAEDIQSKQGTGSVLGDASAKSSSIGNSLDLTMKNSNKDLEYSSQMVRALQAIQSGIGNIASAVGRQMAVGGGLDASKLSLGTNTSGGILGLFGKSVTTELNDSGLTFGATTVGAAIADGITANLYQEILKTTKKSGFLGIGGSTKTTTQTVNTAADAGLTDEVSKLLASMRTAIVGAAGTIGVDGAAAMLDAFQINIGRISLKGLSASEIETELAAVFSRVGDDMAAAIGGGLSAYQHAGEGMLETLMRLAKEYTTVDVSLRSIGMTFGAVGLASVGARDALVGLFGGLDEFTSATDFFRENFLSEAEQMAPVIASVTAEMDRLGLSGVTTKDQFKQVVLGLDLSTDAGQQMYAALMAVAPAFAKTADYTASLTGALDNVAKTAEQLAEIAKQRRSLEIALMDATGDAAGALAAKRADELAGMDESLRALQSQVYAAQDAAQAARDLAAADAEAARAATALASQRRGLEIDLMEALGDAAGAAAAKRADELAALDASLRPLKEQIYAAQDAAAANAALAAAQDAATQAATAAADAAAQLASQRRSLEIALMEATGDAIGATAAKRAEDLAALDASLRPLQQQIYAAQDAAAANAALAAAQETAAQAATAAAEAAAQAAAQIASQRRSMEITLMEATGDAIGATAAKRADEVAALDASLRPLQQQIYAAQDAAAANAALAEAQQSAAAAAAQAAQEQAAAAQQIAQQRATLEIALLRAQGNEEAAVSQERDMQLASTDATLRALQEQVWAAQDAKAAAEAAAQAQSAYAQQQQQAAQDAEQLRRTRAGLQADLLDAMGDATGALALRRREELAAMDASLRPLKAAIYAQQDMAAKISAARSTLTDSYKRESDALQATADKFDGFGESLRKFRGTLSASSDATFDAYRTAQALFVDTSAAAARGDETALGNLQQVAQDFLAASKDNAASLLDYQRDVARVAGAVDGAIGASDEAADYAKLQLDALKSSVSGLIEVNQSVVSVHDAIQTLQAAMTGDDPASAAELPATAYAPASSQSVEIDTAELERRLDDLTARMSVQNTAIAENTGKMARFMDRWDGAGLLVRGDSTQPVPVKVQT